MRAVTELAGIMNGVDYAKAGLTLERMGLTGLGADEITSFAENGSP